MKITYKINEKILADDFIDILTRSTLSQRRPVDDLDCMQGMIENANLMITAWDGEKLVGVARSMTDFHYACYLSDLAVDIAYQKLDIGKKLIDFTQRELGPKCNMILLAAPAAKDYYQHIGFEHHPRCWILNREKRIRL